MGQESGSSLAGSSGLGSLTRLQSRPWLGPQSSQGSAGGGPTSHLIHVVVGRIQFLVGCLDWGPQFLPGCWLEAILSFLSREPLLRAAHNMTAGFIRASKQEKPERKWARQKSQSFCSNFWEISSSIFAKPSIEFLNFYYLVFEF